MLIVGERINTSRKAVNEAVEKRDAAYIQADVKAQVEAGADIIDVNAGSRSASELDDLQWLINVIEEAVPARLSLDSSNPEVLAAVVGKVRDLPMLNSTTAEKARFEKMAPVIKERECDVVALCIGERGVPKSSRTRFGECHKARCGPGGYRRQAGEDTPRSSCSGGQRR